MKDEYDFGDGRQGMVIPPSPNKTRITIRLDTAIVDWFREQVNAAGGGNYQTLINDALRQHIDAPPGALEETLRRVIREEFNASSE